MIRKLIVSVFIMLAVASTAVNAQSLTTIASNNSVAADVFNGSGLIDFFVPNGNNKNCLSCPKFSFLTVAVGNDLFTNNSNLFVTALPQPPTEVLTNGTSVLLKDASGLANDTIRTTWMITTPDSFQIIQDVYPVPFPISGSGQIVYKISVKNLQNSIIDVQAQYLLDNEISTTSPLMANDNDTLATRAGYSPNWVTFPNAVFPGIPPYELAFEAGLCSNTENFPGLIGVGFTNDSLAPEPMGLMMPSTYTFVDGSNVIDENFTFGFPASSIGTAYRDAATLIQWPPNGVDPNSETEIARGSYGTQQCQTCIGNLAGLIFHPEHIKWNGKNYSPQPFPVEAVILDPSNSALGSAKATQTAEGPIQIISPQPTTNNGNTQMHSMTPGTIQECELGDIIWFDSIDNSLFDCTTDSIYDIQVSMQGSGVASPIFLSPCVCPIEVDCQHIQSTSPMHPLTLVLSRTGSYDGSICNMRCTNVAAFDSGGIPGGIKSIVGTSLTNMGLTIAPSHPGADTMFYTVCVQDSLKDGSATITITDTSGNVDSEHYTYCTIADTLPPFIQIKQNESDTLNCACLTISLFENRPWDRGLDSIVITSLGGFKIDTIVSQGNNLRGSEWATIYAHLDGLIDTICVSASDLAGNKFDTCASFRPFAQVQSTASNIISLFISPNPASETATISLIGAPSANIEIFDILGREVGRFHLDGSYDWQTSGLPSGTYILRAIVGQQGENDESITKRIIKE